MEEGNNRIIGLISFANESMKGVQEQIKDAIELLDEEVIKTFEAIREKNALLAEEDKIKLENELLNAELKTIGANEERQKQIENDLELNQIELENIAAHREL